MLSILIPIYNQDITQLVQILHQQATQVDVPFEIRAYDDGSTSSWKKKNTSIQNLPGVIYQELSHNLGRAAIRNKLAEEALFPYLLFLDDDAKIILPDFITNYIDTFTKHPVVVGGRRYSKRKPERKKHLHWKYGWKKEQPAKNAFHSNNFLIEKKVFESIRFNEKIQGYGHEDTLFGWQLDQAGIPVYHIDNPVQPTGLENTTIFLQKQAQAASNLAWLHDQFPTLETPVIMTARYLDKHFLRVFWKFCLNRLCKPVLFLLQSGMTSLVLLDVYKLSVFMGKWTEIRKGLHK
jgi:glycosyltransferase involved in cell wall biosynthesis